MKASRENREGLLRCKVYQAQRIHPTRECDCGRDQEGRNEKVIYEAAAGAAAEEA